MNTCSNNPSDTATTTEEGKKDLLDKQEIVDIISLRLDDLKQDRLSRHLPLVEHLARRRRHELVPLLVILRQFAGLEAPEVFLRFEAGAFNESTRAGQKHGEHVREAR